MSESVKVHARLNDPENFGGESFWATPTHTANVYEVDNVLIAAPIGLGDLVHVTTYPGTSDQVDYVVRRSPRITIGCRLMDPDRADASDPASQLRLTQAHKSLADAAAAHGGHSEGWQIGLLGVVLPENVTDPKTWLDTVLADSNGYGLDLEWDVLSSPDLPVGSASRHLFNPLPA